MPLQVGEGVRTSFVADAEGRLRVILVDENGAAQSVGGGTQYAEDAVHASGDVGNIALVVRRDTPSAGAADGDYAALSVDADGKLYINAAVSSIAAGDNNIGNVDLASAIPAGTNAIGTVDLAGSTPVQFLDVDETEEEVKASAGKLHGYYLANLSAGVRYVKFYDETAANCDVGTDTPKLTIPLAAAEKANLALPRGLTFANGICIAATTGFAVSDTGAPGANDVIANVFYS